MTSIELPAAADFHVHLRDGSMMETVVPTIKKGGVSLVYVMVIHGPSRNYQYSIQANILILFIYIYT